MQLNSTELKDPGNNLKCLAEEWIFYGILSKMENYMAVKMKHYYMTQR